MPDNELDDIAPVSPSSGRSFRSIEPNLRHPFVPLIHRRKKVTAEDIAAEVKAPLAEVLADLKKLEEKGILIKQKKARSDLYSIHPAHQVPKSPDGEHHFDQEV